VIRRTAADREQRNPQTSGAQAPEQHVFGVEGYESVLERVVGGHGYHSILFAMRGWECSGDLGYARVFILGASYFRSRGRLQDGLIIKPGGQ
jgi:hypothetical protein